MNPVLKQKINADRVLQTLYPIPHILSSTNGTGGREGKCPGGFTRNRPVADLARQVSGWTETSTSVIER